MVTVLCPTCLLLNSYSYSDTHKGLKRFCIRISFSDYFTDEGQARNASSAKKYKQIVDNFKVTKIKLIINSFLHTTHTHSQAVSLHTLYGQIFEVEDEIN